MNWRYPSSFLQQFLWLLWGCYVEFHFNHSSFQIQKRFSFWLKKNLSWETRALKGQKFWVILKTFALTVEVRILQILSKECGLLEYKSLLFTKDPTNSSDFQMGNSQTPTKTTWSLKTKNQHKKSSKLCSVHLDE